MSASKIIRNATVTLLKAANVANSNVVNTRVPNNLFSGLPIVLVHPDQVQAVKELGDIDLFHETITLIVDVYVENVVGGADALDDLVDQVINTLMGNEEWTELFNDIQSYNVSYSFDQVGEKPLAAANITLVGNSFK